MAGQTHEAVSSFRAAVDLDPKSPSGQLHLGSALIQIGEVREAVPHLQEAVRLAPDADETNEALAGAEAMLASWQAYDRQVEEARRSPYMEYPAHVHLETLTRCNAACVFCPSSTLARKGQKMPDALISKVIDDLTAIPTSLPFQLSPFKVNDPFMDVRLFDILEEIERKLPNAHITITTNCAALTDKKLAQLAQVNNLRELWISVNDHRPDQYEAVMKMPFGRTLERLDAVHRAKASGELSVPVTLSRVGDDTLADVEFRGWVAERYPAFASSVFPRGNWLGQVDTQIGAVPDIGCLRWFEVSITSTGVVAHCCMDGEARYPIGNVQTQHVLDIYNAPEYRHLRERTVSRRSVSPCNGCTFR